MRIHFVGVCGVSMRQLAAIAQQAGHTVTGSDLALKGHHAEYIDGADLVVYSVAVSPDNCELARARELKIACMTRAQFLSGVCSAYQNVIAVAGSHGKTTATAMAAEVFRDRNPAVHIGGDYSTSAAVALQDVPKDASGASECKEENGGLDYFITEACEYQRSFLSLKPDLAVVLNAELDHTDYYHSLEEYIAAFYEFCEHSESAVVFGDDPVLYRFAQKKGYVTFGFAPYNDYTARRIEILADGGRAFDLCEQGTVLTRITLKILGEHNILNALATAAAGRVYGLPAEEIARGLGRFRGIGRRFEHLGTVNGASVYSDYAHHPTELRALVKTARESCAGRVTVVFEPHTYSRTQSLSAEFAQSLSEADNIYLLPVYAAREKPITGVDSSLIIRALGKLGKCASCQKNGRALYKTLRSNACIGDSIIFAGAGTVDGYGREFIELCGKQSKK